jgi:heme-degrading monooxygenase HmoA
MYVRATTITADPARIDEGVAFVRGSVLPATTSLPGSLGLSLFADRTTGVVTVTTAWESEAARADADAVLTPLRARGTKVLGGTTAVTELFELAVIDRQRPAQTGFWSRMTRVSLEPENVESAIDAYASSTQHDLQLLPGYCSAVLLVDRERGLGVVATTFDSRAHLEASRPQAEEIRRAGLAKAGAEVSDVREAEILIAGLRLPQTGG